MKEHKETLAMFDFDGTITKRDSFIDFLLYTVPFPRLAGGLFILLPVLTGYALSFLSNETAKQKVLSFFFKGMEKEIFYKLGENYSTKRIPWIIKDDAHKKIEWHKQQGHKIIIISASIKAWLQGWCQQMGIELICTQMEVVNNILTGRFTGKNCHGPEKVRRIKELYRPEDYYIYAYGDSSGDKEMLALADEKFYRVFKG